MENQTVRAATPGGLYSDLIEQPTTRMGFWTRLEHQVTAAHAIRLDVRRNRNRARNQGIGALDLPERAFSSKGSDGELRFGHHATLGGRYVNDFRFTLGWDSFEASSASHARTIQVLDAFTSGGAQQRGGERARTLEVENEIEFSIRQAHQVTAGVSIDGSNYEGDEFSNASGTYTFASLAGFEAGQPTTFTQRVGDPSYAYSMYRFGWHVQDDYRVRRNVVINLGLRHDFQTHLRDWANLSPRIGGSWTPSPRRRTTVRASMGVFHSRLDAGTYQQTLLVNGLQQSDLVISDPGYPDPFSSGVVQAAVPPSIIRARGDLEMPFSRRYTVGVDQPIGKLVRFRGTYSHQTGHHLFRSRDANAPVNGVRPDAFVRTITELESTARSLTESLRAELSVAYPPRRFSAQVNYVLGRAMGDTDGPFALPPDSFDLTGEWGPAGGDVRHRVTASVNSDLPGRLRVSANFGAQSAAAYNITTGTDANGDGVNNERPAGVTRNSARGAGTRNLDLTLTWGLGLGQRQSGASRAARPGRPSENPFVRLEVFARATNVLNLVNLQSFSGVLTSPFFGLPTSAGVARRVVIGTRMWF